ncbi:MAG: hypothetical protein JST16_15510 [Bdellovibrionales bacterium]|nr:hypothetical protein [Bdellovibrionales bacterium]
MSSKKPFMNFQVDHMTLLLQPRFYNVAYVMFRIVFGVGLDDILYDKRKDWKKGAGEESMTYAVRVGQGENSPKEMQNAIIAVVQPTEPADQRSHVREMLDGHQAAAHWQHIALRTSDLVAFHKHAVERGVRFITPILKDEEEDLIQVFSGEWFFPGQPASGMFFEFLQRNPSTEQMKKLSEHNSQAWFRDETFLGLYVEKENEYQSGKVTPFIDFALFEALEKRIAGKKSFEITQADLDACEAIMLKYAADTKK